MRNIRLLGASLVLMGAVSCTLNFEDLNTNPNKITVGQVKAYNVFEPILYSTGSYAQRFTWEWNNEVCGMTAYTAGATNQINQYFITDGNWHSLAPLRRTLIPTAYGEALADSFTRRVDLTPYSYLLAITDNAAYDSLVCSRFSYEFGQGNTLRPPEEDEEKNRQTIAQGTILISETENFTELQNKLFSGWKFAATTLTEKFTYGDFTAKNGSSALPVALLSETGSIRFATAHGSWAPKNGETLIYFAAPQGFLSRFLH